jgi:hypothetical protein
MSSASDRRGGEHWIQDDECVQVQEVDLSSLTVSYSFVLVRMLCVLQGLLVALISLSR